MAIRVLLVEDSALIAEDIASKLTRHRFEVAAVFDAGEEALEFLKSNQVDLALLDIRLAGAMDGISTGFVIQSEHNIPIIYLSDLADRATLERAKKTRPSNYITKPFNEADLVRAIEIAFSNFTMDTISGAAPVPSDHIFVRSETSFVRVPLSEILYLHADRSYCNIVTDKKTHILSVSMNHVFDQIPGKDFVRIHRSYVVNVHKVSAIEGNMVRLGSRQLEMGKSFRDDLISRLKFIKQ